MIRADRERMHQFEVERKEIVSADGKVKVTTSGFWVKMTELNKTASLHAGHKDKGMYLLVFRDAKPDFQNFTLEKHHQITRDRMLQKMKNASASDPVSLTIDNHPALQDEVSGTQNGTDIVFLHTSVNDEHHFEQILAWTLKSRWPQQNAQLREITNTFHSEH